MASISRKVKKNGEIVYRIQISIGYDSKTGKRIPKVITFKPNQKVNARQQEKEALKYAMEWEDKLKNGERYDGEEMTFEEYAEKWLESVKSELAYSTYESYVHVVNNKIVPFFGRNKVGRIRTPLVESFYKTLVGVNAHGTIRRTANVLSGMFRTAVRWQMIQINPCRDAKLPRMETEECTLKYFTPEQSLMFLRSLDMTFETLVRGHQRIDDTGIPYYVNNYTEPHELPLQLKLFFTLSLYCGLRKGETLALHWDDIDFDNQVIHISKSLGESEDGVALKKPKTATSVRTVFFPEKMLPLLRQYKKEYTAYRLSIGDKWQGNGNLFIQWDGKIMGRSTPYQSFKRHLKRYNGWVSENEKEAKRQGLEQLPIIPLHGLRHSCATLLNYLDVNIIDISKILGHAKSSTTMDIYAHSFEKQNKDAVDRLNEFIQNNCRKQA